MLFWKKKTAMTSPDGWLKVDYRDADVSVQIIGRLDHTLRNTIRGTLQSLLERGVKGAICIQMIDVFLLDTSTAAGLVAFLRDTEQSDVQVEVSGASQVVKRVFEGLGASEFLNR